MKVFFVFIVWLNIGLVALGQQAGDTIVVSAFNYGSSSRDTVLSFPDNTLSFEKIILRYNMRCKNAMVSNSANPNQGCGEWDYSCNSFIVDSSRIEELASTHPKYSISNFDGTNFPYRLDPIFDFFQYHLHRITIDTVLQENQFEIVAGQDSLHHFLNMGKPSGKYQTILSSAELLIAGLSVGNIDGIILELWSQGGQTRFLKIRAKEVNDSILSATTFHSYGFTDLFFDHYNFVPGENPIVFSNPFNWSGNNSILLEFSFTNSQEQNQLIFAGDISDTIQSLWASNPNSIDLSHNGLIEINPSHLWSIQDEISVGFWSFGSDELLPANTSIFYAYSDNPNNRQLNIHLPWSNASVYFDCGFNNGYNRIQKAASANEIKGRWNHWVFTKNANTGVMRIFLNGNLWHSGNGMYYPVSIMHLLLGSNQLGTNNYKGKIKELSIWDKALDASNIFDWKNRRITNNHPDYNHLLAYYRMDEGSGTSILDSKNGVNSQGEDFFWTIERGEELSLALVESKMRPAITLIQGDYLIQVDTIAELDSLVRSPNVIKEYELIPAAVGELADDLIQVVSSNTFYHASVQKIFDGETGLFLGEIPVLADDSIQLEDLAYFRRFPFYNEILSFVTPYGLGLNLGIDGKTWYFDVSDFAPILKGEKRFMMTGGVWQEELDIDFLFIVGTPPREVVSFEQLWQGQARLGQASIAQINQDIRFPPVDVDFPADASQFKIRATITGHGSEGEFHMNGGEIEHYLSIAGGNNDFSWKVTEECAFNPVFPQGGTWVYDRQGWCPGQVSLTKEFDISSLLVPGTSASIDYHCSAPIIPGGDYRYIVAVQLISYGEPNHNLDAAVLDILSPTNKVLYSRKNPICANPTISVQNTGANPIYNLQIEYWLNEANQKQSFMWEGLLNFMDTTEIILPIANLWNEDFKESDNRFKVEIVKVNQTNDDYIHNNFLSTHFETSEILQNELILEFRTNNNPEENSYRLIDDAGNIIIERTELTQANFSYTDTMVLNGCYTLIVEDSGHDGLQWWANPDQGSGAVRFKRPSGTFIKNFERDFGGGFQYSFSTEELISIESMTNHFSYTLYPNPNSGKFRIKIHQPEKLIIELIDLSGKKLDVSIHSESQELHIDAGNIRPGIYFLSIIHNSKTFMERIVIQ